MLRRAWRFARPYRVRLLGYLLLTAAGGGLQVLPAFVVQRLVDETLPSRSLAQVVLLACVLLVPAELAGRRMRRLSKEHMKRCGS